MSKYLGKNTKKFLFIRIKNPKLTIKFVIKPMINFNLSLNRKYKKNMMSLTNQHLVNKKNSMIIRTNLMKNYTT